MKKYLTAQLKCVEKLERDMYEPDEQYFDDFRALIRATEKKAALSGCAQMVQACQIRRSGITADYAREVLAKCLAIYLADIEPEFITIESVAEMVGVHPRTIRRRWYDKSFPPPMKMGRKIRWRKLDVENYRGEYQ